ncbi:MAG: hypothetical protein HUU26_04885 [Gemmatimonadaceae bacterium]|nr:hypothetical protein [Gemmatimonadaceae bacterium]
MPRLLPTVLPSLLLALAVLPVAGQAPLITPDSARPAKLVPGGTEVQRPERLQPSGVRLRAACDVATPCTAPASAPPWQDAGVRRGRYVLAGFLLGAGAGWVIYSRACSDVDCTSPIGGVMLSAVGGAVGMLVALLLTPAPG